MTQETIQQFLREQIKHWLGAPLTEEVREDVQRRMTTALEELAIEGLIEPGLQVTIEGDTVWVHRKGEKGGG